MNNTDTVYVGWISIPITMKPPGSAAHPTILPQIKNIQVFTHKAAAHKWKNKLNRRNQKTYFTNKGNSDHHYTYLEAGFDELLIDRESK
jgi:hypothetical protein